MKSKAIGWLILLAALAVPALFFQNFLVKMKTAGTTYEVKRKPEGATFGGVRSEPGGALPNPIQKPAPAPGGTGKAQPDPGSAPAAPPGAPGPASPQPAPASPQPASGGPAASPDGAASEAPEPRRGGQSSDGKDRIEYAPQSERDPTLSVIDEQKLALEREAQRRADEDMQARANEAKKVRKASVKTSEDKIQIQGIVGSQAIVNDEVHKVGDKVMGCTVTRVTSKGVFFKCGGKSFYKTVQ